MQDLKHFDLHVDGSCLKNGTPGAEGGWAFVVTLPASTEIVPDTETLGKLRVGTQTNNRAELEGVLRAILWVQDRPEDEFYTIWCDSELVVQGITGAAGRHANRDIWEPIERLCRQHRKRLTIKDVDAHEKESTDPRHVMNCYVDRLAKQASNSLLLEPAEAYE